MTKDKLMNYCTSTLKRSTTSILIRIKDYNFVAFTRPVKLANPDDSKTAVVKWHLD
jgi:hypothetical protein